jgi:hypothetical protein
MVRMLSKRILAVVLALALALPGAALAQSAGDEQYVDPFQESQGQQQEQATPPPQESGSQGGAQGGDGTVQAPAETQVVPEAPPTAASTTGAPAVEGSETLPVTGLPAAVLALAGVFLVAAGGTLRRRA